jgi:hypothetical protein
MSAGHADALDLLAPTSGDVEDATSLAIQIGAEDVDREAGFRGDNLDAVDVMRWQEGIGRAAGQQLVGNLGDAAVARGSAVILTAVAGGALRTRVHADQPPGDVVVDRGRKVRAKEHAVDVE